MREIARAARFRDIGNLTLPDAVLHKQGGLTPEERQLFESHTLVGAELLGGAGGLLDLAAEIALGHHEHWDGSGYPHGLRGDEISLPVRIVAVADGFHALVDAAAPGARPVPVQSAVAEVERAAGTRFDPAVVDAFSTLAHHGLVRPPG